MSKARNVRMLCEPLRISCTMPIMHGSRRRGDGYHLSLAEDGRSLPGPCGTTTTGHSARFRT